MHRTETADSFRRFSEKSEVLFGLSIYSDAVSAGDLSVRPEKELSEYQGWKICLHS